MSHRSPSAVFILSQPTVMRRLSPAKLTPAAKAFTSRVRACPPRRRHTRQSSLMTGSRRSTLELPAPRSRPEEDRHLQRRDEGARRPVVDGGRPGSGAADAGLCQGVHLRDDRGRDWRRQCRGLAKALREVAPRSSQLQHAGDPRQDPKGREGKVVHLVAQQLFDLSADLSSLADRDGTFRPPTGRGNEFVHGSPGMPDPRGRPPAPVRSKDIFEPDRYIGTLKIKSRNFQ